MGRQIRQELDSLIIKERLNKVKPEWVEKEVFYLECNPGEFDKLVKMIGGPKKPNKYNTSVGYLLGITDEPPRGQIEIKWGQLPDLDFDISDRKVVKEYLKNRYGDRLAYIGTYSSLQLRSAFKDLAREEGVDFDLANKLSKKLVFTEEFEGPLEYLDFLSTKDPDFIDFFKKFPEIKEKLVRAIGTYRQMGIHAGGVCVTNRPIYLDCPVVYNQSEDAFITTVQMKHIENLGVVKYDFLGLNSLKIISDTLKYIENNRGQKVDLSKIDKNDPDVFETIRKDAFGVFQFGTPLAMEFVSGLKKINNINDLAIITSLLRPGPMNIGMHEEYKKIVNGEQKPIKYNNPIIDDILSSTYGLFVYQEQIMRLANRLGKIPMFDTYSMIKAISKKDEAKIMSYKSAFLKGAVESGLDKNMAEEIFDKILSFASYGFNKSHAISYAYTSYITAYLKTHYLSEFLAANLNNSNNDDLKEFTMRYPHIIRSPSVNVSKDEYVIYGDYVFMKISHIMGIGPSAETAIIDDMNKNGKFASYEEFVERLGSKISSKTMLSLCFSGFFDSFRNNKDEDVILYRKRIAEKYLAFANGVRARGPEEVKNGATYASITGKSSKKIASLDEEVSKIHAMTDGEVLAEQIRLCSQTNFDYYSFFYERLGEKKRSELMSLDIALSAIEAGGGEGDFVSVFGVGEIRDVLIKNGKNAGKAMAFMTLHQAGKEIQVSVSPDKYSSFKAQMAGIKQGHPVIAKIRAWTGKEKSGLSLASLEIL